MMLSLKKVLRFMAVLFVMFCICRPAFASDIPITAAYFPDESFRRYVLHGIDTDQNGILSEAEANAVLLIDVRLEFELASLEGISYFPNFHLKNSEIRLIYKLSTFPTV